MALIFCSSWVPQQNHCLDHSPLFSKILNGVAPTCKYTINGNEYNLRYYLADGTYPDWSTLVKTISKSQGLDKKFIYLFFSSLPTFLTMYLLLALCKDAGGSLQRCRRQLTKMLSKPLEFSKPDLLLYLVQHGVGITATFKE